jgi:hypothetical protein
MAVSPLRIVVLVALFSLDAAALAKPVWVTHVPTEAAPASFHPVHPPRARQADISSLPPVLQGAVSAAVGERDPAYRVAMDGKAFRAKNARQGLDASVGAEGMAIAAGSGQWRMRFSGWQRGASLQPAATLATRASANRVEVDRGGVTEWWVNGPVGLQQGWTVASRPFPEQTGALMLVMAQSGSLRAKAGSDKALDIADGAGRVVLRYGGLTALDATGRELPVRFEVAASEIRVRVDDGGAVYPVLVDPIAQQAYLKASNSGASDQFGISVAISGDTAVVAAIGEDSNATGVDGNQADDGAPDSGAAYVFVRNGSTWSQQAYLKASNTGAGDRFGTSVAISGDTVVVGAPEEDSNATGVNGDGASDGAPESGAAYVFVRSGTTWSQQAFLKASNTGAADQFGWSVAISGDTVVVGARMEDSGAAGVDGNQADNGAFDAGAAYVFVRSGLAWSQQAYLKASNTWQTNAFGHSLAISGNTVVVGARYEASSATGVDGNQADLSAYGAGAAYVFVRNGSAWSQQAYLKASNTGPSDYFGYAVAISGDIAVVGAIGEDSNATGVDGNQADDSAQQAGAAYVFVRSGTTWSQHAYLKASNTGANDFFGDSVAISGDTVVVGAPHEASSATGVDGNQADESAPESGAAYVFARSGTTWGQQAYVKASNTGLYDSYGISVAVSGDTIVVGAEGERSSATGVDGNQADDSAPYAGAAYVLGLPEPSARLVNISTRMQVLTGTDVMIGGFVIGGAAGKTVAIVATGPSLVPYGITNPLANPMLTLVRSSDQAIIDGNDDWQAHANAAQLTAAGFAPTNALEAALLVNLPPGAYTAIVEGVGGGTGVSVIGVYEVDGPQIPLINISTRGRVLTGADVMIGGFVIQGSGSRNVAIVATGPSLAPYGIANPLANPTITLVRSSDQVIIASNDDWQADAQQADLQAAGFAPTNPLESGLYRTLPPGAYTVIVEGVGNGTGVSVIGIYRVP